MSRVIVFIWRPSAKLLAALRFSPFSVEHICNTTRETLHSEGERGLITFGIGYKLTDWNFPGGIASYFLGPFTGLPERDCVNR